MVECVVCHRKGRDGLKAKRYNICVACTRRRKVRQLIEKADPENDPIKYTLTDLANAYLDALEGRDFQD